MGNLDCSKLAKNLDFTLLTINPGAEEACGNAGQFVIGPTLGL